MLEWVIPAMIITIVDGDTAKVKASIWLDQTVEVSVRIKGIDTPEIKGRCPEEKEKAAKARDFVTSLFAGREVFLSGLEHDKYGGRIVANVTRKDGLDWGRTMLREQLALPYGGGTKDSWCKDRT